MKESTAKEKNSRMIQNTEAGQTDSAMVDLGNASNKKNNLQEESRKPTSKKKVVKVTGEKKDSGSAGTNLKKSATKKENASTKITAKKKITDGANSKVVPAITGIENTEKQKSSKRTAKKTGVKAQLTFVLRYHTQFGQLIFITGSHKIFGGGDFANALAMEYLSEDLWALSFEVEAAEIPAEGVSYNYVVRYQDGYLSYDWGSDKKITPEFFASPETLIVDSWNFAGYFENVFYTEPFKHVLLKNNFTSVTINEPQTFTHTFKIKAPLLRKGETVFLTGNNKDLGDWGNAQPVLMSRKEEEDFFSVKLDLSKSHFPIIYKYGVFDVEEKKIVRFEEGHNRLLHDAFFKTKKTIVNDGFAVLPANTWRGAGVAIPVFSLRTEKSFGVGEFNDIKLLVDWAKKVGLKLVQILPVNDTTATHTWTDSYPYSAISAFAFHPMYLNLEQAIGKKNLHLLKTIEKEQHRLNKLDAADYEAVNNLKWRIIKQIYPLQKDELFASKAYKDFCELNQHWLIPYAAFCYFREKYKTADFNFWGDNKTYHATEIEKLLQPSSKTYDDVAIYFFVQYHLHVQLKQATQYAHRNGIIVKGDIPIGVYRYGADAWQHGDLYHMEMQAGAPPDDFAVTGQNWGFPTYNWHKMRGDGYAWWKQRFEQMSYYFDAFRIDHILGFFRIWSIPFDSIEGIMGHFEPAIPVHINEFNEQRIWFDQNRYCNPYINDGILYEMFGQQQEHVKHSFLNYDGFGQYKMKSEFATQRQVEEYFSWQEENEHTQWLKRQLFSLISNVILFEAEDSEGKQYHFRFGMQDTSSFRNLNGETQHRLNELYTDYFFKRQDSFWMQQAMQKLPALKRATNMLICGEDLGLVPASVPEVMRQTGILSLEIQRMPKDPKREFFHPADAPYMSVVTPSTHDMSTIRGWWEEDRARTQHFFNNELGQWGDAPYFCDAWVNEIIVLQHLYSPAMWSIFQLQDLLGTNAKIRRPNPHEERINVPANPKNYWKYRMHLNLEELINASEFNESFASHIRSSERG